MKRLITPVGIFSLIFVPLVLFAADDSFVPLTSLPGLRDLASSPTLPDFLNSLYRISIGAVAVLAVLQITYAGWEIMTSADSITKNKKAKDRIRNAVFGLVLVLSPAIVFGLINPKILDLNFDVSALKLPGRSAPVSGDAVTASKGDGSCSADCAVGYTCKTGSCVPGTPASGSCTTYATGKTAIGDDAAKQACCQAQQGCSVQVTTGGSGSLGLQTVCSCQ